jgi:shikimate dehydrogenase
MDISEEVTVFDWQSVPDGEYAVIGDPIGHSLSPRMHAAAYENLGLDLIYRAVRVPAGELSDALNALRDLGYLGVNVTVPHKEAAFDWCDHVEDGAWRFGAVNTVRLADRVGINTDVPGFMKVLADQGITAGSRVLFLGAGGSARALIAACCDAGFEVGAWNRTRSRLDSIISELGVEIEVLDSADVRGYQAVINATSASLGVDQLPVVWESAPTGGFAFDLAYGKDPSLFLQLAMSHGWAACDGLPMLVEQGALAFEWWLGKEAPRGAMLRSVGL